MTISMTRHGIWWAPCSQKFGIFVGYTKEPFLACLVLWSLTVNWSGRRCTVRGVSVAIKLCTAISGVKAGKWNLEFCCHPGQERTAKACSVSFCHKQGQPKSFLLLHLKRNNYTQVFQKNFGISLKNNPNESFLIWRSCEQGDTASVFLNCDSSKIIYT